MIKHDMTIHIWVIIRLYYPNFSGAAIQAHQIFSKLVRQGFSVTVLTTGHFAATSLRGQRTRRDGIDIRYLRKIRHKNWASVAEAGTLRKIIAYLEGLLGTFSFGIHTAWTLLREGQPDDIVRVYSPDQFSFLPVWTAKVKGMHPVLHMTLLNSDDPGSIKEHWDKFSGVLRQESFYRAEAITGYSSEQIRSCLSAGLDSRKVFQIPAGVNVSKFMSSSTEERIIIRKRLGLKSDSRFIVFVGNAIARKGLDVLVAAFLQIRSQISGVELLIVGPYDFSDPRYKLASDLKDELEAADYLSHVHWIGRVDNVHDYMRAADIFCLPTRREGFGIVIIEAMAAGLPVVVARLEGVTTDIIQSDREGILITDHIPSDYAGALLRLLRDPSMAKSMGNAARERVINEFSLEHVVERYAQLYRELAGVNHA